VIKNIKAAVVFLGPSGIGPWQSVEQEALLIGFAQKKNKIIPVILPGGKKKRSMPEFLKLINWVDFRRADPDPLGLLAWGLTGKHPTFGGASNSVV
jgi:hypothetical protein